MPESTRGRELTRPILPSGSNSAASSAGRCGDRLTGAYPVRGYLLAQADGLSDGEALPSAVAGAGRGTGGRRLRPNRGWTSPRWTTRRSPPGRWPIGRLMPARTMRWSGAEPVGLVLQLGTGLLDAAPDDPRTAGRAGRGRGFRSGGGAGRRREVDLVGRRPGADRRPHLGHVHHHRQRAVLDQGRAVPVGHPPGQHRLQVRLRVVVAEHGRVQAGQGGQVAAVGAQVAGGGQGGVEDVVRVLLAVAVAVGAPEPPGGRDELHRSDRPVIDGVAVEQAVVGIGDDRVAGDAAVEPRAEDPAPGGAIGGQPAALGVPGLGVPDPGQQPPGQVAGRLLGGQPVGSLAGRPAAPSPGCRAGSSGRPVRRPRRRPGRPVPRYRSWTV